MPPGGPSWGASAEGWLIDQEDKEMREIGGLRTCLPGESCEGLSPELENDLNT